MRLLPDALPSATAKRSHPIALATAPDTARCRSHSCLDPAGQTVKLRPNPRQNFLPSLVNLEALTDQKPAPVSQAAGFLEDPDSRMQQAVQAGGTASAAPPGTRQLLLIFAGWKVLLILVACASPGPGYDTSTRILLDQYGSPTSTSLVARALDSLVLRLTRWDGIYFASSSTRGHAYEQEWAFSWVLAKITSAISRGV